MKNIEDWNLTDLADFFEGFHEVDGPLSDSAASECTNRQNYTDSGTNMTPCDHQWVSKAGAGYRATPVAVCIKCHAEKTYCAKCGQKP